MMKAMMIVLFVSFGAPMALAKSETMAFHFENAEITDMIKAYSKASGQKFVVDPAVRGKASILVHSPVTVEEAFNLLSSALAINSFAISEQGDTMVIKAARNIQRDLVPVSTELPPLKPERLVTWVIALKHQTADEVNKRLRMLQSKDGEMTPMGNRLIITDFVSNLHRVAKIIDEVDQPMPAAPKDEKAKAK